MTHVLEIRFPVSGDLSTDDSKARDIHRDLADLAMTSLHTDLDYGRIAVGFASTGDREYAMMQLSTLHPDITSTLPTSSQGGSS